MVELQRQDLVFMGNKCADNVGQKSVMSNRPGGGCIAFALAGLAGLTFALVGARLSSIRLLWQRGLRRPRCRPRGGYLACVGWERRHQSIVSGALASWSCRRWSAIFGSLQLPFLAGRRAPISSSSPICARFGRGMSPCVDQAENPLIALECPGEVTTLPGTDIFKE